MLVNIKKNIVILRGDLNAKIGADNHEREEVMGKHGVGVANVNGERLIELCGNFDLVIGDSLFPHKRCHKVSWVSPDHQQKTIDHFIISRKWRRSLLGVGNKPGADVGTDHHLTVATLRLKIAGNQKEARRFDVNMLRDDNVREHFSINLQNKFEALADL